MIELVDTAGTTPVVVEGTTFHVKQLTNGEKARLVKAAQGVTESEAGFDDLMRLVGGCVKSIEGMEGQDPVEVVVRIKNLESQRTLLSAVIDAASLDDSQIKNSNSSSDSRSPAGDNGTAPKTVDRGDASPSEK